MSYLLHLPPGSNNNVIDSNLLTNGQSNGVYAFNADSNTYTNNRLENLKSIGFELQFADSNYVVGNFIFNCWSAANGIWITNANANTVFNNTIDSSASDQVSVSGNSTNNVIDSNLITNGASRGIATDAADSNTYRNNRIENSKSHGIIISGGSDSNVVTGNRVFNCWNGAYGLYLSGVYSNNLSNNTFDSCAGYTAYLNSAPNNTLDSNAITNGLNRGIVIQNSAGCTFVNNLVSGNASNGIEINSSVGGVFTGNRIIANGGDGVVHIWSSTNNLYENNLIRSNGGYGVRFLNTSNNNTFIQNEIDSNAGRQIWIDAGHTAETFVKNIITPPPHAPTLGIENISAATYDFTRTWWGTRDTTAIGALIANLGGGGVTWSPFRIGMVDTTAGADTVAPKAPDTVAAAVLSGTSLRVSWSPVTANEEGAGGAPGLNNYTVYRSLTAETSQWLSRGTAAVGTLTFDDTGLTMGTTYYYRVTATDNKATFANESFYSDSIASGMPIIDTSGPNVWYVNDTSQVGDSFTSAIGYDTANGLTPATPKRTITAVMALLTAGDTVYIDSGIFAESVAIATDSIALIGAGRNATFISSNTAEGIRVSNAVHTRIRDLAVTSTVGVCIFLDNASRGEISECRIHDGAGEGIYLTGASTANRLYNNVIDSSSGDGISVDDNGAKFNIIDSNLVTNGRSYGIHSIADSTTMTNNRIENNDGHGIFLVTSETSVISGNRIFNCRIDACGIMISGGQWHRVFNNTIDSSSSSGISLAPAPFCYHLIDSNLITNGRSYGIFLGDDSNTVTNNRIENNDSHGIYIASSGVTNGACGNTIAGNYVYNNRLGADGIHIDHQSRNNVLRNNFIDSNSRHGITSGGSSRQNLIELNLIRGNGEYGVYLASASAGDTYRKNNILPSAGHPDSAVFSAMSEMVNFERNWLGSTADLARITCGGNVDSIPFRLGMVDTAAGADTVAPRAPDTVATAILTETSARISWSEVTTSEEAEAAVALAGYRVYRGMTADTLWWQLVGQTAAGTEELTDSGLSASTTYYYRVTAFDTKTPFVNESFYSDSIIAFQLQSNRAPVARATASKSVAAPGTSITVSAATSSDSDGDILSYRWTIETGTPGLFSDSTVVAPTFTLHASYEGEIVLRVVVTDSPGLADTTFVSFIASFGAPRPVVDLQALASETGSITLFWTRSPSSDVAEYRVLTDSGIGALPETMLATVAQTTTSYSLSISGLTNNREYRYSVLAVDSQGLRSETAHASAVACTAVSNVALSAFTSPSAGTLIPRNTLAVPLTYELGDSAARIAEVTSIAYQYRPIGGTTWLAMPAATGVTENHNPATPSNAVNPLRSYTFFWSTSILDSGSIELRIVVTGTGGETRVSGSGSVRFVDPTVDSPTVMHGLGVDTISQHNLLSATRAESVTLVHPGDTQAAFIGLPANAFPSATDSAGVYFGLELLPGTPFDTLLTNTQGRVYSALEVKLSNGDTAIAGGQSATVRLSFRDRNPVDGFVDGTRIRWNTLKIYRHSGVAGEAWIELATTASQYPTATADGWIEAQTTRFSIFQLVGVAASVDLSNVVIGPNPFRPNDGNAATGLPFTGAVGTGIYFSNLPAGVKIEVFTITGRRVMEFQTAASTGQIQWDVRNQDGRDVASGVYLYRIQDLATGQVRTGKLTVIR